VIRTTLLWSINLSSLASLARLSIPNPSCDTPIPPLLARSVFPASVEQLAFAYVLWLAFTALAANPHFAFPQLRRGRPILSQARLSFILDRLVAISFPSELVSQFTKEAEAEREAEKQRENKLAS
jgi:hypothetical protein